MEHIVKTKEGLKMLEQDDKIAEALVTLYEGQCKCKECNSAGKMFDGKSYCPNMKCILCRVHRGCCYCVSSRVVFKNDDLVDRNKYIADLKGSAKCSTLNCNNLVLSGMLLR